MQKVLIIHTYYKLKGGEDSVVENEMELLRSNGLTVELLSFSNSGNTLLKLAQLPFNFSSYRQTKAKIASFKPDVVHIHNLHFSGSAAVVYAVKNTGTPLVMTLHNYRLLCPSGSLFHNNTLFMDSISPGFPWLAVKEGVYQNSSLITFWISLSMYLHHKIGTWKRVDRFISLGIHSKELFSDSALQPYADRLVVKPNFCYPGPDAVSGANKESTAETNDEKIAENNNENTAVNNNDNAVSPLHYLYVGRLTEEKGLKVLLAAFAENQLPLVIVGTGPLADVVTVYTAKYKNITYKGEQKKKQIVELLDHAKALIFPSLWYETFGMVVIEAFSRGIPVITSNHGNMKNLVTDQYNGLTFNVGSSEDLSKTVSEFEQMDHSKKNVFRQNARTTYVSNYSPERNFQQLLDIYKAAISMKLYRR